MKHLRGLAGFALIGAAALFAADRASGQILFSDDFQTDSSNNWSFFTMSANAVTNDYNLQFAFDYSAQTYAFNGATLNVPPAPNSGGTTKGLKVTVNKNGNAQIAAISLYPKNQSFSNDYALKFDLWMDYNGDVAFGGSGSTEFATFGLNHYGTELNWPGAGNGDGLWFGVDGEGGTTRDFVEYAGDPTPGPSVQLTGSGGFLDRDFNGTVEDGDPDGSFSPFQLMFPSPEYQTGGAIGKHWVQVELRQRAGVVTWLINGYIIVEQPNNFGFTSGDIMLGYMDTLAEIANPPNENYAIFDNVRVVDLTTNTPLPEVSITASNPNASEPSNNGLVTVTRSGDTTDPLTVPLYISGTAESGLDYVAIPSSVTIPAGASSADIAVQVLNDNIGEAPETVQVAIVGSPNLYDVRYNFATVTITDDNDLPKAGIVTTRHAFEHTREGRFTFSLSNPNAEDTTINYTIGGTAVNGTDYATLPGSITIPAGSTNALLVVSPIDNSVSNGTRTISLTLASGTGYTNSAATNATMSLRDDELPAGVALFADDFDNPALSGNWIYNKSQASDAITYAYDYSADGIAPAPHTTNGTTLGLKLEANITAGVLAGVSASPVGGNFTGDYRLRFDLWINYNGPVLFDGGSQSTEFLSAGVGTKGNIVEWYNNASADGIWFSCDGDSGNGSDYRAWKGNTHLSYTSYPGVYPAGTQNGMVNAYYNSYFGDDPAPDLQRSNYPAQQDTGNTSPGNAGFAWHDSVITKQGSTITWTLDGLLIATVDATGTTLSTNIFVGYYDSSSGICPYPMLQFGLVDNLKVETLSLPKPTITGIQVLGGNVQIDFTATTADTPASFKLQSSATVNGSYTDVSPAASLSQLSPGVFRAITPVNGATRFFRVRR